METPLKGAANIGEGTDSIEKRQDKISRRAQKYWRRSDSQGIADADLRGSPIFEREGFHGAELWLVHRKIRRYRRLQMVGPLANCGKNLMRAENSNT
jgi:hypothetical protein